jgi:hypothetical protein
MGLFPKHAAEYVMQCGIPIGPQSKIYVVDPQSGHGSDSNTGLSFKSPLATLAAAEDLCVANHNDVVLLVGGPTGNALAEALAWDKAYTHLVGMSAPLAMGQRCRVTGSAALDLASLITFSGAGCICKNVQFQNGSDAAAIKAAVIVSGSYCYFENCQFGLTHATAASTSGSYALGVTGSENTFVNCAIGNDTVLRAGTNVMGELSLTGGAGRNVFKDCRFLTWSETAGKFLVTEGSTAGGTARWNEFENCIFQNFWSDNTSNLDNAFDLVATAGASTYNVILRGACQLVNVAGWADVATWIHTSDVNGAATYGIDVAPST